MVRNNKYAIAADDYVRGQSGTLKITKATSDGIHANDGVYVDGGNNVACGTINNDAIDSNGILTITDGKVFAIGAKSQEEGFDCDNNTFKITEGLLIGVGRGTI